MFEIETIPFVIEEIKNRSIQILLTKNTLQNGVD